MDFVKTILENIKVGFTGSMIYTSVLAAVLLVALCLSAYEFLVYRLVSRRALYNKSFNISLAVLPFFISTIVLCLQSNVVITLGTIGALAIIRFRTAIKDPVDMIYLLWAIHIGITCGCQLYEVAVLTSLIVTIVLLIMENINIGRKPFIMVVHCEHSREKEIMDIMSLNTKKYRVKSRNYKGEGIDFVFEFSVKDITVLVNAIKDINIDKFSIMEYDSDDII